MPRADDPRIVVRMSPQGFRAIKAAADSVNVAVSGLVRECAERYAVDIAREVAAGRVTIRRNSVPDAVTGPSAVTAPRLSPASSDAMSHQRALNAAAARRRK